MTKILEEVRQISSDAIALKQKSAENNYPKLIEQIKGAAALGKTRCTFMEYEIDQYSKRLLELDGFKVWATTQPFNKGYESYVERRVPVSVWEVSW